MLLSKGKVILNFQIFMHQEPCPWVRHFVRKKRREMGPHFFSSSLTGYDRSTYGLRLAGKCPGNVRELENVLERAINFLGSDTVILPEHLPETLTGRKQSFSSKTLKEITEEVEMNAIMNSLIYHKSNKTDTANALGISRTSLYEKMKKYGIGDEN